MQPRHTRYAKIVVATFNVQCYTHIKIEIEMRKQSMNKAYIEISKTEDKTFRSVVIEIDERTNKRFVYAVFEDADEQEAYNIALDHLLDEGLLLVKKPAVGLIPKKSNVTRASHWLH